MQTNSTPLTLDARHRFHRNNPVDFELLDDEGRQHIYILNDQSPGRTHHLLLINNSDEELSLKRPTNRLPSADNHHFELRLRPGTLAEKFLSWLSVGTGGWRLATSIEKEDPWEVEVKGSGDEQETKRVRQLFDDIQPGTVSLYLLFVGEEDLALPPHGTLVVILNHIKAGVAGGSRGSRMELRYRTEGGEILYNSNPATDIDLARRYRQERLQIINHRGKKELPMKAAFLGSSTVLNDGKEDNHLVLQVSNFLQNSPIALNARDSESPTKFILSFDTSEEQAAWALSDPDNAAAIDVEVHFESQEGTSWQIRPAFQGNNPQWAITLIDDVEVPVGDYFHLHLEGLKTSQPSGFTTLYLLYENIPGFWDGRFEIPIEKSPLKFDDQKEGEDHRQDGSFNQKTKVGIGKVEPQDTLDVNGGVMAETLVLRRKNATRTIIEMDENGEEVRREEEIIPLKVNGKIEANRLRLEGDGNESTAHFSQPDGNGTALQATGDANVSGKLSTTDLEVTGTLTVTGTLADSLGTLLPKGAIIMWSGTNVPDGWMLCNGEENTPNLSGRFIVGYDKNDKDYDEPGNRSEELKPSKWESGKTGGDKKHQLSIAEMPSHHHPNPGRTDGKSGTDTKGSHSHLIARNVSQDEETKLSSSNYLAQRSNNKDWEEYHLWGQSSTANVGKTSAEGSHYHHFSIPPQGNNLPHENRPPYYVLAFIMKK